MMRHITLFRSKSAEPIPCVFSSSSQFFSSGLSQQQEHITTRLHCPWFSVEGINSYELILYNGNEFYRQRLKISFKF